jgi:Family of unknown function (DUF6279)
MIRTESGEAVVMMLSLRERSFSKWRWIIGVVLALALCGCSVLRIAYSQAPTFAYWWIDGYVDLTDEQSVELRDAIDRWFDWHRRTELPRYAALLVRAQREVMEPTLSTDQLCAWRDEAQRRLDAALDEATPAFATLLLSLSPEQIRHMERKLAKDGDELKGDFAQPDRNERTRASFKRTLERYENLYGKLDEAQRTKLAQLLAASPFDAERWLAERERRNRDLLALLTTVSATGRDGDAAKAQRQAQAAVRVLAERALRSPRPEYRAYQERLAQENCALASAMHNITTPAQRQYARNKLKSWEDDLRLIVAGGNGNGNGNGNCNDGFTAPATR